MCENKSVPICPEHIVLMSKIGIDTEMGFKQWECPVRGCNNRIVQTSRSRVYNLRMWTHGLFDIIWQGASKQKDIGYKNDLRDIAYDWLGEKMGMDECHIAQMQEGDCLKAIEFIRNVDVTEIYPKINKEYLNEIHNQIYYKYLNAKRSNALYMQLDCFPEEKSCVGA